MQKVYRTDKETKEGDAMELETKEIDHIIVVKPFTKRIDATNGYDFRAQVQELLTAGHSHLILNLALVTFIDSNGLGTLISTSKTLKGRQGSIAICRVADPVASLFKMTGIDRLISIYPTEEEALQALQAKGVSKNNLNDSAASQPRS